MPTDHATLPEATASRPGRHLVPAQQPPTAGLITAEKRQAILRLDATLREARADFQEAERDGNDMLKGLLTATAMQTLRDLLTDDMMRDVMTLHGSPLGFRTDRDHEGKQYPVAVVKDVLITALLKGFRPVGNEFNIIGGNFYATQAGLERVVAEFPGLTDLRLIPGVPTMQSGGALVPYKATWRLHGVADQIDCRMHATHDDTRIPVRVNAQMGCDAILGKAKRKMLARIYERLTGSILTAAEDAADADSPGERSAALTADQLSAHEREQT